jgi:hypothetical protein
MRGNAPSNSQPECTIEVDFIYEGNKRELWAATVVQGAWQLWRELMGMLLLLRGLADLNGSPATQYAAASPSGSTLIAHALHLSLSLLVRLSVHADKHMSWQQVRTIAEARQPAKAVVFVCWLRVDIVPLSVATILLGALGSLRLLSILTIHSVSYPGPCRL